MEEEKVIEKLGIAKSSTIQSFSDKSYLGVMNYLKRLEKFDTIKIVVVHYPRGVKRLYMKNDIYTNYFN